MSTKFTRRKLFGLRTGDTEGGTVIEYGLIAALIALVLVGVLLVTGWWDVLVSHLRSSFFPGFSAGV